MDFYDQVGRAALGSRLRRLGDRLAEEATRLYPAYGIDLNSRWLPVMQVLFHDGETSISALARRIGHTHASISQIVRDLVKSGQARLIKKDSDARRSFIALTAKGRAAMAGSTTLFQDVGLAVGEMLAEAGADLWAALAAVERVLERRSLVRRTNDRRRERERKALRVVDYTPRYASAFKQLNEQWIKTYFKLEPADRRMLNDPAGSILRPGGAILVALHRGKPIGVCALVPHGEGCLELAKMAVSPKAQGLGAGELLGTTALAKARKLGARRLFLESNTKLEPAIALYRKLGFTEIVGGKSPYRRANIQMELALKPK